MTLGALGAMQEAARAQKRTMQVRSACIAAARRRARFARPGAAWGGRQACRRVPGGCRGAAGGRAEPQRAPARAAAGGPPHNGPPPRRAAGNENRKHRQHAGGDPGGRRPDACDQRGNSAAGGRVCRWAGARIEPHATNPQPTARAPNRRGSTPQTRQHARPPCCHALPSACHALGRLARAQRAPSMLLHLLHPPPPLHTSTPTAAHPPPAPQIWTPTSWRRSWPTWRRRSWTTSCWSPLPCPPPRRPWQPQRSLPCPACPSGLPSRRRVHCCCWGRPHCCVCVCVELGGGHGALLIDALTSQPGMAAWLARSAHWSAQHHAPRASVALLLRAATCQRRPPPTPLPACAVEPCRRRRKSWNWRHCRRRWRCERARRNCIGAAAASLTQRRPGTPHQTPSGTQQPAGGLQCRAGRLASVGGTGGGYEVHKRRGSRWVVQYLTEFCCLGVGVLPALERQRSLLCCPLQPLHAAQARARPLECMWAARTAPPPTSRRRGQGVCIVPGGPRAGGTLQCCPHCFSLQCTLKLL